MAAEKAKKPETSCVEPAKGPLGALPSVPESATSNTASWPVLAQVGKPAPDFEANIYIDGGFKTIRLSDYLGKWVVLCFYPGDFTFV